MSAARRPRPAPITPGTEPDTPSAHYTDAYDEDPIGRAHVHEHAPVPDTPPRRWRRKGAKIALIQALKTQKCVSATRKVTVFAGCKTCSCDNGRANPGILSFALDALIKAYEAGLSQRAWIVLGVIAAFILFSKLLLPSGESHIKSMDENEYSLLIPHDYLNASATDPAPFEFCPVFGPGDPIAARRGQFELLRSRIHMGTGARVQRVLRRAMAGMPITISVLGGSVSACHGAGEDPVHPECYPARFFQWWNSVFPHPNNELTNGANKRTDSAYYAYCSSHHLPDKTDLVILEFDAADPNDPEWLNYFELMVRSILVRPEQPAVIVLGHFSPQVQAQNGFAGPELLHNAVAQFYDVPHISTKGVMYDAYLEQPLRQLQTLYTDPQLANRDGHDLLADVLISYIMSQICSGWSTLLGYTYSVPAQRLEGESVAGKPLLLGGVGLRPGAAEGQEPDTGVTSDDLSQHGTNAALEVPKMRLNDRPNSVFNFRELEPYCVSASDLVTPLPPSIFFGSGWATYNPPKHAVTEDRHYWYADKPSSRLRVPLRIGAGDVGVYFLQSPLDKPHGTARCWVDDNVAGATTLVGNADVEEPIATLVMIDQSVSRGSHFVECQLEGEPGGPPTPFKILGIFAT